MRIYENASQSSRRFSSQARVCLRYGSRSFFCRVRVPPNHRNRRHDYEYTTSYTGSDDG
jgi:hypothetical protein